MGMVQRLPRAAQTVIHYEVAARYLPDLVSAFKSDDDVLNPPMRLVNVISYTYAPPNFELL